MEAHKVILKVRLAGISRAPDPALPSSALPPMPPPQAIANPAPPPPPREPSPLTPLLAELTRLIKEIQTRDRHTLNEVAQLGVELGAALAERLLNSEISADRQRLDRIVLDIMERMQAARPVAVRGHADDLALLQKQIADNPELEPYREALLFRREDGCQRGQLKFETDECFFEWNTQRSLAELRASLLEETLQDE